MPLVAPVVVRFATVSIRVRQVEGRGLLLEGQNVLVVMVMVTLTVHLGRVDLVRPGSSLVVSILVLVLRLPEALVLERRAKRRVRFLLMLQHVVPLVEVFVIAQALEIPVHEVPRVIIVLADAGVQPAGDLLLVVLVFLMIPLARGLPSVQIHLVQVRYPMGRGLPVRFVRVIRHGRRHVELY